MSTSYKVSETDLKLFIDTFKTSNVAYAVQYYNKEADKSTWFRKEKDVNFERDAKLHLEGSTTIGSYTIFLDGDDRDNCAWCVLDFDIPKKTRISIAALPTEEEQEAAYRKELLGIKTTIKTLLLRLPELGLSPEQSLVEFSGNKGYHIWFFFEDKIPARNAFLFLNGIKKFYDLPKSLEAFPKQVSAGSNYGNLIKLPLGIHQSTKNRCVFIDILQNEEPTGLSSQFDRLRNVGKIDVKLVDDIINRAAMALPEYDKDKKEKLEDLTKPPFNADIREICKKCQAFKRMEEKAKKDNHLIHNERMALLSMYIHFGEKGLKRLHKVLSNCSDYDQQVTEKMIQHGLAKLYKPATCAKLQEWHICNENCKAILNVDGTSPIKFAYKGTKTDLTFTYIEEMEKMQCVNKTVKFPFKVTSLIQSGASYAIDREITVTCPGTCPERYLDKVKCPYAKGSAISTDRKVEVKIKPDDAFILQCVDSAVSKMKQLEIMKAGIPCIKPKWIRTKVKSHHNVMQILIASSDQVMREQLFETKTEIENKNYIAYYVSPGGIQTGHEYMGYGKILQHPDSCKLTFIITKVEPLLGNLSEFNPDSNDKKVLEAFKAIPPNELIKTLAEDVIGVKDRETEVLCALLTFFSPLQLYFNKRMLKRGWMETCFVGDSSQGKSLIPTGLMQHAGFNNEVSGGHATEAGILGGIASVEKKQYISWGMLPRCDKTLVFLDEIELLQQKTSAMKALREVRSTGIATITKIIHGTRLARVRLIASANAYKGESISTYKRGCQALVDILEAPDIRRFDLVCFFYQNDVDVSKIMQKATKSNRTISADEFRMALRFIWTRTAEEFIFTEEVTTKIFQHAMTLYNKYKGAAQKVPLITIDVYEKLARVTMSFANLRMRTTDYKNIVATISDADAAYELIDTLYSSRDVALDVEAQECIMKNEVSPEWMASFKKTVAGSKECRMINLQDALKHLSDIDKVRGDDFAYYLQTTRNVAVSVLQLLTVEKLVDVESSGNYKPTSKLYKLISMLDKGEVSLYDEAGGDAYIELGI